VNLGEIARGPSRLEPETGARRAARIALDLTHALIAERRSFSIETRLAGRAALLSLAVRSPEICLARIARRVSEGGHDVPEADVRHRFERAIGNLSRYVDAVDVWRAFDNNGGRPQAVAEGRRSCIAMLGDTDGLPGGVTEALGRPPPCPAA